MIETMMGVAELVEATRLAKPIVTGPKSLALRRARFCYDHLASEVAVGVAHSLAASGHVELTPDGAAVTEAGLAAFDALGLMLDEFRPQWRAAGRVFCHPCMDWSERRPHLAGMVGRLLFQAFPQRQWLMRASEGRVVTITPAGAAALDRHFGIR
jgi:ribosomal protein S19E (S16A)